jgi:hypothetical protein
MPVAEATAFGVTSTLYQDDRNYSIPHVYKLHDDCHQERIHKQNFDSEDMLKGNKLSLVVATHKERAVITFLL